MGHYMYGMIARVELEKFVRVVEVDGKLLLCAGWMMRIAC
jgi:hypothetical protein